MIGHPKPPPRVKKAVKPLKRTAIKQRARPLAKGVAKIRQSPYQHPEYLALAAQVRERSKGVCEACRRRPGRHVHHLRYIETGVRGWRRLMVPLADLLHVCLRCHDDAHPRDPKTGAML